MTVKQPRVLHVIHSRQRRGAEVFALQLASSLQGKGVIENGICSLYDSLDENLLVEGLTEFRLKGGNGLLGKLALDPGVLFRLHRLLCQFCPDVVVAHGGDTLKYTAASGIFYRRASSVYRNIGVASFWAGPQIKVGFNRMCLKGIDAIVSVSQYTQQDFIRAYRLPTERVTTIFNGVSTTAFNVGERKLVGSEIRSQFGLSLNDLVFITVGNLSGEKGHSGLLKVISRLKRDGQEPHLLIVGDGPLRQELEEEARQLDIENCVYFLGVRNDVSKVLIASDLFVLPSTTEGMPAVLIEAGLAGLASVAFDVGGVAEVVEHQKTGLLVPPGRFPELGDALVTLGRMAQCRIAMGEAARERCLKLFDVNNVADEYQDLFLKMINHRAGKENGTS